MEFYYDETFHDKKIRENALGQLNTNSDNSNDMFIYSILGFSNYKKVESDYLKLEGSIKKSLGLGINDELKSTTFNKKNFKYGLKSMNKQCKDFYTKFLNMLVDNNGIFQVGMLSKTEYVLTQLFESMKVPAIFGVKTEAFIYSLTKFIDRHRLDYLFDEAFKQNANNGRNFKDKVIELLEKVLDKIIGVSREESEVKALKQDIEILKYSIVANTVKYNEDWDYSMIAEGVKKRLIELNLEDSLINIDIEQSTYYAFTKTGINSIQLDSKTSPGVRMTDMFLGFIGRIVASMGQALSDPIIKDINKIKREDYVQKRLLPNIWFDVDEDTYNLYKKLGNYFASKEYWSTYTMYYFDSCLLFFSLFNYFNQYGTYEEFIKNKDMHKEYFNTFCCNQLQDRFSKMK